MKKLFSAVLVGFLLLSAGAAEAAKARKASSKAASVTRISSAKSTKASSKRIVSKRKTTSRRTATRRAVRPSSPTPERYMDFQRVLADKGFYNGPIDGVWGPECVAALKKFQESEGLAVDGKLGARSIIALGLGPQRSAETQLLVKPPATADEAP